MVKDYIPGLVVTYIPGQQNPFKYHPLICVHVSLAASSLQALPLEIHSYVLSYFSLRQYMSCSLILTQLITLLTRGETNKLWVSSIFLGFYICQFNLYLHFNNSLLETQSLNESRTVHTMCWSSLASCFVVPSQTKWRRIRQ